MTGSDRSDVRAFRINTSDLYTSTCLFEDRVYLYNFVRFRSFFYVEVYLLFHFFKQELWSNVLIPLFKIHL